jgi:hypothetical protein
VFGIAMVCLSCGSAMALVGASAFCTQEILLLQLFNQESGWTEKRECVDCKCKGEDCLRNLCES